LLEANGGRLTMPRREILAALEPYLGKRANVVPFESAVSRGEASGRIGVDRTRKPLSYWLNREP
jgi:hypothetical protein